MPSFSQSISSDAAQSPPPPHPGQVAPGHHKSPLSLFPCLLLFSSVAAVVTGLLGTWLPSVGFLPAIGKRAFTTGPWTEMINHPATAGAVKNTLLSGTGAAAGAFILAVFLFSINYGSRTWAFMEKMLAPILSVPHAAFAIGLTFLIAPGGWLVRLASPGLTGYVLPPDWIIPKDPYGLTLMGAMIIKETPFLILVMTGALQQIDYSSTMAVGRSLGYQPARIWINIILPQLFPHMRLSLYAVLAYSLSVVDLSLILGPTSPPTLQVLVLQWFNDPAVEFRLMGAAGATLLLIIVALAILSAYLLERIACKLLEKSRVNGRRTTFLTRMVPAGRTLLISLVAISAMAVLALLVWSFTWRWGFPDPFPERFTTRFWERGISSVPGPLATTLLTGLASTFAGIVLTIGCLEYEGILPGSAAKKRFRTQISLVYLPLLLPQVAFIFGVQIFFTYMGLDGSHAGVVWSHLIFVLPYLYLTLGSTYRSFDKRYTTAATILCGSPVKAFFRIKLPMLLRPILFSCAVGFSVSVAQYIPTLFIGAGRFATITTEVVTMAGGSDRRAIAVLALFQQLIPMAFFLMAIFIPKLAFIRRRGMQR